ncbi:hypothetical protein PVAND_013880 [Polypedilum vanderplanki]|uniref:Riboflavin kinase n=1 Tax=Polypedilum vanderplanki TaxID=319348 RepID=A0A9J6CSM6_POLVA|nr:hypothetical protein PVAND_013880 [Polypedilum vanderplanki]
MRNLSKVVSGLPHFACGQIIKGFGRGSKQLGIPTANYPLEVVENLPKELSTGIYYGYASIDNGEVHKMVMSIGMNPYFENKHKSMETHILHNFMGDLYGHILKVCIVGYLRPEKNFDSLEALIDAIKKDISDAEKLLDNPENLQFRNHEFFKETINGQILINGHHKNGTKINGHI